MLHRGLDEEPLGEGVGEGGGHHPPGHGSVLGKVLRIGEEHLQHPGD